MLTHRWFLPLFALVVLLTPSALLAAPQAGDIVVAKQPSPLRAKEKEIGKVEYGDWLSVEKTNDQWLWVKPERGPSGWVAASSVVLLDEAMDHFQREIKKSPTDYRPYAARAQLWQFQFEWEKALADYNLAVKHGGKTARIYTQRGILLAMHDKLADCLADLESAIQVDPKYAEAYAYRGLILEEQGKYEEALRDLSTALRLDPTEPENHRSLALVQASCPVEKYRNGMQALEHGLQALKLAETKQADHYDVVAMAYAELGNFPKAIEYGQQAVNTAPESLLPEAQSRLTLYKAGKPYRRSVMTEQQASR